jgi:hypothetical protein
MSDANMQLQMRVREIARKQTIDRRVAIAALVVAVVLGSGALWNARMQIALSRKTEAQQAWGELVLRADDEHLWSAKKTLRAYIEQTKRMPGALAERNGLDGFVIKTSTRCLAVYVYDTIVLPNGATDDCLPKTTKPEDKEKFYTDIDMSRRLVKAFHEKLMLLDQQNLVPDPVLRRFMSDSTVDFLTTVWLPVEKALNHVVEKDADARDRSAQAVRDWYAERVKKIKEAGGAESVPETSEY